MQPTDVQRCKIYIVDGDECVCRDLGRLMLASGLNFDSFASGESLIGAIDEDVRGCAVINTRMPGLSGCDIQKKLTHRGSHIPVIALAEQGDAGAQNRARELGAVASFYKPVDNQALLDAIRSALK